MLKLLNGWAKRILQNPEVIQHRGYQSYVVLSLCRALYTLRFGEVASKPVAASWAQGILGEPWVALIADAWEGRHHPDMAAKPEGIQGTLDLIQYAIEHSQQLAETT